jgi:hypothetical protein
MIGELRRHVQCGYVILVSGKRKFRDRGYLPPASPLLHYWGGEAKTSR